MNNNLSYITEIIRIYSKNYVSNNPTWDQEILVKNTKLDGLITVVDLFHFYKHKDCSHVRKQISFADVILLNKTDLINKEEQKNIEEYLNILNPLAKFIKTKFSAPNEILFNIGGFDLSNALKIDPLFLISNNHKHSKDINAISIKNNQIINGDLFNKWIYKFAQFNGENLYRYKGIINLDNEPRRFVFQGVHMTLDGRPGKPWGKGEKRINQVVFIGRNLDDIEIIASRLPGVQIYLYHHDIFKNDFQIEIDSQRLLKEYNNVKLAKQLDVVELS